MLVLWPCHHSPLKDVCARRYFFYDLLVSIFRYEGMVSTSGPPNAVAAALGLLHGPLLCCVFLYV